MKKFLYIFTLLILTACGNKGKEGGIPHITTTKNEEVVDESNISIEDIKPKSPVLKQPSFEPKKLDYEIIKPEFLVKDRFTDLKTQDKYAARMMEFYDEDNEMFYVSRIITEAIQDPKVKLENNFDDKMNFVRDLFLLSPFYSEGSMEPYIYANYWFDEETFKLVPRYKIEENTKTYMTKDEQAQVENQLNVLVEYANKNYDNDYDKAYYFAQWIAENNKYQFESDEDNLIENNMYGAMVKGLSQCSGFAQSFAILCQRVGIPSYSVTGMVANGRPYYFYYFDRSKKEFVDYYVSKFFDDIEEYIRW